MKSNKLTKLAVFALLLLVLYFLLYKFLPAITAIIVSTGGLIILGVALVLLLYVVYRVVSWVFA